MYFFLKFLINSASEIMAHSSLNSASFVCLERTDYLNTVNKNRWEVFGESYLFSKVSYRRFLTDWCKTTTKSHTSSTTIAALVNTIIQMTNVFCFGRSQISMLNLTQVIDSHRIEDFEHTYVTCSQILAGWSITNVFLGHVHLKDINVEICVKHDRCK